MLPKFDPSIAAFSLENAYVLMRASQVTYVQDDDSYRGRLKELGLDYHRWISSQFDACFVGWNDDFVILSFRGTANAGGWVSNVARSIPEARPKDYYGRIHPGFADALDLMWEELMQALADPDVAGKPLFITGHSRGGAIATLAAQSLVYREIVPVAVYTYGSPRVGNTGFANRYEIAAHYRIENDRDIVPHVPPRPVSAHVGTRYWINSVGDLTDPVAGETPDSPVVQAALETFALPALGVAALGLQHQLAGEFFSDHANTEYAHWLWNALPEPARSDAKKTPYA